MGSRTEVGSLSVSGFPGEPQPQKEHGWWYTLAPEDYTFLICLDFCVLIIYPITTLWALPVSGESKNTGTSGSESSKTNRKTQAHASNHVSPIMAIPSSAITAPTTTLNIGMDYWGGPSTAVTPLRSKLPITPSPAAGAPARSAAPQEIWSQVSTSSSSFSCRVPALNNYDPP